MRRLFLFLATVSGALAGCSALLDFNALVGPADGGDDGPATGSDGSTRADTSSIPMSEGGGADAGDVHAGPNLLANGTFETGCDHWSAFQGTVASDPTARSGSKSCRVCTLGTTTDYYTGNDNFTGGAPKVGSTYHAQVWVRFAPGATHALGVDLHLRMSNATPAFANLEGSVSPNTQLADTWTKVETTFQSTMAAQQMDIFIASVFTAGSCFLMDDAWLERLP